ncbi:DUF72 domain-containing protein [Adhaeribacter sp. BT258]|uniref:DUF72 domain-containing protein n=1 Tax=Adhaeribacter terrigena TaxID=2793070 RepID=A0ABS1BZC4_9BACT|nr:DUF72 domain-containing protein [Adhaeribacter terrigena]MBK0402482.1 DUF72 domain-containing protein [Adhaeribacter terrigena]
MENKIYIGTSGWHYKHWVGTFYPAGTPAQDFTNFYLRYFRTVEINNSFYKLPTLETFASWRASVPNDFVFAVKASRYITHLKKLKEPQQSTLRFFENLRGLGKKTGPVLFQLPPAWKVNPERLQSLLQILPPEHRYTFEFRDQSWYMPEIYDLLQQHNAAFCIYELAGHQSPLEVTADFVYIRLHGPSLNKYQGSYPDETLGFWAEKLLAWQSQNKSVYLYFDNDQEGYAAFNARRLQEMILQRKPEALHGKF